MPLNVPPIGGRIFGCRARELCFAENGIVHDEGQDHPGREAIQQWKDKVDAKHRYVSEPLAASVHENTMTIRARLTGDFPGSPVEVNQVFTLKGGKIASLEIHS